MDVLGHVRVELLKGIYVGFTPAPARELTILDSAELVVLQPKIALDDLRRREKPQNGGVPLCELVVVRLKPEGR
jgi:hypothetical protein